MAAITFDTLLYAKKLKNAGFTEQQAEVQAESLKQVIDNTLVTKHDIEGIYSKLDKVELTLTIRFGAMLVAAIGILAAIMKF